MKTTANTTATAMSTYKTRSKTAVSSRNEAANPSTCHRQIKIAMRESGRSIERSAFMIMEVSNVYARKVKRDPEEEIPVWPQFLVIKRRNCD
jgi:hypothetical protein